MRAQDVKDFNLLDFHRARSPELAAQLEKQLGHVAQNGGGCLLGRQGVHGRGKNPITCTAVAGLLETRLLALQLQAYWKPDYLHGRGSGRPQAN